MTREADEQTPTLRVYVNGKGIDVPTGATALDAVRAADPDVATAVASASRAIADSRGLPIDPATPAYGGAIYRIISARGVSSNPSSAT